MIEVVISERKTRANGPPTFRARIFAGPDLCRSHQPLHDGARELLNMGYSPDELVVFYHEHPLKAINKPQKIGDLCVWSVADGPKRLARSKYVADLRWNRPLRAGASTEERR